MIQSGTCAAIIVAAGRGERAGNPQDGPKQYRTIGKYPIIHWTLRAFLQHSEISTTVVVIHPDDHHLYAAAVSDLDGAKHVVLVDGGWTRQQSVLNGLEALERIAPAHVLIHDGVRPFIDDELISEVLNALNGENAAVLPALPLADTIKKAEIDGLVASTVSREGLFAAQTPQGFCFQTILLAHRKASAGTEHPFTDDCSIAEWDDIPVRIIGGSPDNVKLTVARDIQMADEKLMRAQKGGAGIVPDVRTGNGYDVHALTAGNFVTLCGVDIPHDHGLLGHSDADVALHALTDALLATCGAGDIGDHFPPSDPQWKDARSDIFLNFAAEHVKKTGGTIMNADVTLICEAPKIGPHRQSMRQSLADILQIEIVRCSVKATTNEGIGFVGRREGIAAIATATVVFSELNNDR